MYNVLSPSLKVLGSLTLKNGPGSTSFWSDSINQQIADDGATTDPNSLIQMTQNAVDLNANHKLWNHTVSVSFDNSTLGKQVVSGYYLTYVSPTSGKNYLMTIYSVKEDTLGSTKIRIAQASNSAIYELGKIYPNKQTFNQVSLKSIMTYLSNYIGWSVVVPDDNGYQIPYTIDGKTSAMAIVQDLLVKFDIEADAYVELNKSGQIYKRIIEFGKLGINNGDLIRYGSPAKGFESISQEFVSDTLFTKLHVKGVNDSDISSVNQGNDYILDDVANAKYNPVGASLASPTYLEGTITNNILSEPKALLAWGREQIKVLNHPRINYVVTAMHDNPASIGDSVAVQDMTASPAILIKSRVIQTTTSFSSPETNQIVLGEFSASAFGLKETVSDKLNGLTVDVSESKNMAKLANDYAKNNSDKITGFQKLIDDKVNKNLADAKDYSNSIVKVIQADVASNKANIDKAVSDAKDRIKSAQDAANNYAKQLTDDAKLSVTTQLAEEIKNRDLAISNASGIAKSLADQARIDAINASTTADGLVHKYVDDQINSVSQTYSQTTKDLNGKISTAQSTATQALDGMSTKVSQTDYDSKTGDLDTKVSQVKQKADGITETIGDIKQKTDSQDSRLTTVEKNANGMTITVSDLKGAVDKQSGTISQLKQQADGFEATVNTKIDNLVYENRNLIIGSKKLNYSSGMNGNNVSTITVEKFDDATNMYHIVAKKGVGSNLGFFTFSVPTINNTPYTYSFDIKGKGDFGNVGVEQSPRSDIIGNIADDWSRVSTTRTTNKPNGAIVLYFSAMNQDLDVYVKLPKLEYGAKPTAYTEAPEDITNANAKAQLTAEKAQVSLDNYKIDADGRISKAQSDIAQTANSIKLKVNQTDYDSKTGELNSKVGKIELDVNSIKSTVDSKASISYVDQRADSITSTVSTKIDNLVYENRNYVLNGGFENGTNNGYGVVYDSSTATKSGLPQPSGKYASFFQTRNGGDAVQWFTLTTPITIPANQSYTISYDYSVAGDAQKASDYLYYDNGVIRNLMAHDSHDMTSQTTWKRVSYTFIDTKPVTITKICFGMMQVLKDRYGWKVIDNIKIEYGSKPTAYTQAPEDIDNAISTIKQTADKLTSDMSNKVSTSTFTQTVDGFNKTVSAKADSTYVDQTAKEIRGVVDGKMNQSTFDQREGQIYGAIKSKVDSNKIVSAINLDTSGAVIKGDKIILDGTVTVTQDFYAKGGNFKNLDAGNITTGNINTNNVTLTGIGNVLNTTLNLKNNGISLTGWSSRGGTYTEYLDNRLDMFGLSLTYTGIQQGASGSDSFQRVGGVAPKSYDGNMFNTSVALYADLTGGGKNVALGWKPSWASQTATAIDMSSNNSIHEALVVSPSGTNMPGANAGIHLFETSYIHNNLSVDGVTQLAGLTSTGGQVFKGGANIYAKSGVNGYTSDNASFQSVWDPSISGYRLGIVSAIWNTGIAFLPDGIHRVKNNTVGALI